MIREDCDNLKVKIDKLNEVTGSRDQNIGFIPICILGESRLGGCPENCPKYEPKS